MKIIMKIVSDGSGVVFFVVMFCNFNFLNFWRYRNNLKCFNVSDEDIEFKIEVIE